MSDQRVAPGDILARKYRVERVLGQGAMGVVVAATHVELGQLVALKMMLPEKEQTPEMRERFLREARAAVRLKSQHVARVLDVGSDDNGMPYIAMEFLEGDDLSQILKNRGPLPFGEAVEYVLQACEAVGEAHAAGIVHRDLKPANLFLTKDVSGAPCVKVLDFGISKLMGAELALTQETQALGSPLYMSPEALGSAKNVDTRTDIWALGIILYQLVAGKTPFHAPTMAQLCMRIVSGPPTPLADYRTDAPPGFESVILRCLERDRDKRFDTVAAFAAALLPFAPARARVYIERIARVMGVNPEQLIAAQDESELQATMPLSKPTRPVMPSLPGAGATSQTAVVVSAASDSLSGVAPVKRSNRAPLIAGALVLVGVIGIVVVLQASGSSKNGAPAATPATTAMPAASATTQASIAAPATNAPVEKASATAPTVAPSAAPTTNATVPVATVKTPAKPKSAPKVSYDERQ